MVALSTKKHRVMNKDYCGQKVVESHMYLFLKEGTSRPAELGIPIMWAAANQLHFLS